MEGNTSPAPNTDNAARHIRPTPGSVNRQLIAIALQQRFANTLDLQQLINRRKVPVGLPIRDDSLGLGFTDTGQFTLQCSGAGLIQINLTHALLNNNLSSRLGWGRWRRRSGQ